MGHAASATRRPLCEHPDTRGPHCWSSSAEVSRRGVKELVLGFLARHGLRRPLVVEPLKEDQVVDHEAE